MKVRIAQSGSGGLLGLAAAALLLAVEPAMGVTVNLTAGPVTVTVAGNPVPMWGFGLDANPPTVPGPAIVVPPGDTSLTINLTNNLPEPVSIVIPGQIASMTPVFFFDAGLPSNGMDPADASSPARQVVHGRSGPGGRDAHVHLDRAQARNVPLRERLAPRSPGPDGSPRLRGRPTGRRSGLPRHSIRQRSRRRPERGQPGARERDRGERLRPRLGDDQPNQLQAAVLPRERCAVCAREHDFHRRWRRSPELQRGDSCPVPERRAADPFDGDQPVIGVSGSGDIFFYHL